MIWLVLICYFSGCVYIYIYIYIAMMYTLSYSIMMDNCWSSWSISCPLWLHLGLQKTVKTFKIQMNSWDQPEFSSANLDRQKILYDCRDSDPRCSYFRFVKCGSIFGRWQKLKGRPIIICLQSHVVQMQKYPLKCLPPKSISPQSCPQYPTTLPDSDFRIKEMTKKSGESVWCLSLVETALYLGCIV